MTNRKIRKCNNKSNSNTAISSGTLSFNHEIQAQKNNAARSDVQILVICEAIGQREPNLSAVNMQYIFNNSRNMFDGDR